MTIGGVVASDGKRPGVRTRPMVRMIADPPTKSASPRSAMIGRTSWPAALRSVGLCHLAFPVRDPSMNDETAFWQGLAANPEDDALRLAFARWLEERNHPRSSWIRNPEIVRAMVQPWADPTAHLVERLGQPYRREHVTAGLVLLGAAAVPSLLPALASALRRNDDPTREQIHHVLEHIGSAAVSRLPELRQQLSAEDPAERRAAIEALRFLGTEAAPALTPLCDRLREDDWQIVLEAVQTIGAIGPAAGPAVPDLQAAYQRFSWSESDLLRPEIVKALGQIGPAALPAVPTLMSAFILDPSVAEDATSILIALGPAAAEPVLQHLGSIDREEERYAADVLASVAPDEMLFEALDDKEMEVYRRRVVLEALARRACRGTKRPQAEIDVIVLRLVRILREEESELQNTALDWLKNIGRAAGVALPGLREVLRTASGWLRGRLAAVLVTLGAADDAVAELATRLRSADAKERAEAVGQLWRLPQADDAGQHQTVALLVPLFRDPDAEVRHSAVHAVANLAKVDTPGALPALWAALKDSSAQVRQTAVQGLARIQEYAALSASGRKAENIAESSSSVPHLIGMLRDADAGVRATTIKALNRWPVRVDVVAALREFLHHSELVDSHALDAVAERHTLPGELLPEVMLLVRDPNPALRSGAVRLLSRVESTTPEGAAVLCQALRDRQHTEEVVRGLKRYGPLAAEALPDLMALIAGSEVWTEPVDETLASLGPAVVPAMCEWLRSGQPTLVYHGAQVLYRLGAAGSEAIPDLLEVLLNETPYDARLSAGSALCQMGRLPADAVPGLVALTEEREPQVRATAVQVLGRTGSAARPALPTLERMLEDGEGTVRHAAIQALAHLGGELAEALPPLSRPFRDTAPQRREEALTALQTLDADVHARAYVYPLIQPSLVDPVRSVRRAAWTCVGALARSLKAAGGKEGSGPSFQDLFTLLRSKLRDPDPEMRNLAGYQIGQFHEAGAAAVPDLLEMLDHPETRCTAINALGDIGPPARSALPKLLPLARGVPNYEGQIAGTAVEKIEGKPR